MDLLWALLRWRPLGIPAVGIVGGRRLESVSGIEEGEAPAPPV